MGADTLPKPPTAMFNSSSFSKISTPTNSFAQRPIQSSSLASFKQPSPFLASSNSAANLKPTDSSQTNLVNKPSVAEVVKPTVAQPTLAANNQPIDATKPTTQTNSSKSPKFFLGDDDSNSSDALNDETDKKPASVTPSETDSVFSEKTEVKQPVADLSAKPKVGGSWSMLKNAAKSTSISSTGNSLSSANLSSAQTGESKSNAVDSFQKYKMQLKQREQESLKAQREKDQIKSSLEENKPSPGSISSHPISPLSIQQPVSNNPISDMDSNSQFSPQAPPSSSSHQDSLAKSDAIISENSQPAAVLNSASNPPATVPEVAAPVPDAVKRAQSIQEMREKERRRREEIAGKIDMTEQHKLISQFEQNFAPPS